MQLKIAPGPETELDTAVGITPHPPLRLDPHTSRKCVRTRVLSLEIKGSGLLLTESIRTHFGKTIGLHFPRPPPPNAKSMVFLLGRIFPNLAGHSTLHLGGGGRGMQDSGGDPMHRCVLIDSVNRKSVVFRPSLATCSHRDLGSVFQSVLGLNPCRSTSSSKFVLGVFSVPRASLWTRSKLSQT